jgi:hypothetical protein
VLAHAIVREGAKAVAAGMNPMDLKRGVDLAVEAVVADLQKNSKNVTSNEEIAQVGTISANGDADIVAAKPLGHWWLIGLAACWVISLFVYSFSVYSTIYPEPDEDERRWIDRRYAGASIACGFLTTVMVIGIRIHYGVLQ